MTNPNYIRNAEQLEEYNDEIEHAEYMKDPVYSQVYNDLSAALSLVFKSDE